MLKQILTKSFIFFIFFYLFGCSSMNNGVQQRETDDPTVGSKCSSEFLFGPITESGIELTNQKVIDQSKPVEASSPADLY